MNSAPRPVYVAMAVTRRDDRVRGPGPIAARRPARAVRPRLRAARRERAPAVALCDVRGVEPDAVTVDALARLQLAASRSGCRVELRNASTDLLALVEFMGLADVLGQTARATPP